MRRIAHNIVVGTLFVAALFGAFFVWTRRIEEREIAKVCPESLQYSYFSTPDTFDKAYQSAEPRASDANIKGLIVPHHLLAASLIAEAFEAVETERPKTVVLVSPNHFMAGQAPILTTPSSWRTPYGQLESDCDAVERLARVGAAAIEEEPFTREHGISGIVPFIKKSMPNARIVPLIVKETATDAEIERVVREMREIFGSRVLVVGSFDFTHELTDTAARFHDRKSLAVLRALDDEGARAVDIDSRQGLRLVMRFMDSVGARRFSLFAQSNSAELTEHPGQPDVTSYLVGSYKGGKKEKDATITLLAFGDMMLARGVEALLQGKEPNHLFAGMPRLFKGSDLVTANAEGVFIDVPEEQKPRAPDDLRFPFEPWLLSTLKRAGFTHLGYANNHALNFGTSALEGARELTRQAGLVPFGDPSNRDGVMATTDVRGRAVVQIGYHQFGGRDMEEIAKAIVDAKRQGAFIVVYPHWGVEYERFPTQAQKNIAHAFIDAGADVVLGAHPHVIQPIEVYKGKAIFYSLGNFIFDQSFSAETSQGLAVGIAADEKETVFHLMPIEIRAVQPSLMSFEKRGMLLRTLAEDSYVSEDVKAAIASGIFTLKQTYE
ncbi:MAG: AmmeMemoRadiSam system protein B [Patescibacteria group bacterium]|nr:MAG: AmmeMemoRadiSam system protein B [Patescibacteria group bacterium]